ncbi:MAG: hypothetical protein MJZ67_07300 [Bacteroidales bacterium]|nr:hypothetical protein [Bacteroidales bacterium]
MPENEARTKSLVGCLFFPQQIYGLSPSDIWLLVTRYISPDSRDIGLLSAKGRDENNPCHDPIKALFYLRQNQEEQKKSPYLGNNAYLCIVKG